MTLEANMVTVVSECTSLESQLQELRKCINDFAKLQGSDANKEKEDILFKEDVKDNMSKLEIDMSEIQR